MGVLQDHCDIFTQHAPLNIQNINAVNGNGAFFDIIKTVQEVGNCGFTRSGGAYKGNFLPRLST